MDVEGSLWNHRCERTFLVVVEFICLSLKTSKCKCLQLKAFWSFANSSNVCTTSEWRNLQNMVKYTNLVLFAGNVANVASDICLLQFQSGSFYWSFLFFPVSFFFSPVQPLIGKASFQLLPPFEYLFMILCHPPLGQERLCFCLFEGWWPEGIGIKLY